LIDKKFDGNFMSTIDDIKEQLSCCIDGELDQQELNQLIDNLLEDSSQGEQLRNEWKDLHLISTQSFIDVKNLDIMPNQTDVLPLVDISAQISKKIADEQQIFPLSLEPDLIKAEISSIPDSFGLFKLLAAGSAIAASLVLVVVNVINTENGQFLEKGSDGMTQNIKPEQTPNIAVSRIPVSTPVKKKIHLLRLKIPIYLKIFLFWSIQNQYLLGNYISSSHNKIIQ
jgi:negative regulator of sigma E activity